jgi:hypothetical protein
VHGFALAHHAANENPIATRLKAAVGT